MARTITITIRRLAAAPRAWLLKRYRAWHSGYTEASEVCPAASV